jgi:DNA-binding transcriptional ArsR family regulator
MPLARRRVTEAGALKALGHPLRMAILGALVTEGPLTATQAAERVDASPSNCSWHLRRLAEDGFVREARGGTGRHRPWQAVSEGLEWGDDPGDGIGDGHAASRLAAEALGDVLVERELQRLRAARASRDREPEEWREATGISHAQVWLTAEQARDLRAELSEVVLRHADLPGSPASRPADARLVSLVGWLVPSGPHRGQQPVGSAGPPLPVPAQDGVSEPPAAPGAGARSTAR